MTKKRVIGLDIIRSFAILFVISVHFFSNSGFYEQLINSSGYFGLFCVRNLFFICVPLFLLLTGYLVHTTKTNRDYFYKIFKVLISYLIITIIVIIFKTFYLNHEFNILSVIFGILAFKADPYAWYVEMYLGLFLFIPFLNILYDNISKNQRKLLIIILIFVTAIGPITNNLSILGVASDLFPDWWMIIYPITYFFLGRYLFDYHLNISNMKKILIILLIILIHSALMLIHNYNITFDWNALGSYGNIFTLIIAILIFELLYNKNINNRFLNKSISLISKVSFEMYLLSYIFDNIFYKLINLKFNNFFDYLLNYFVYVPLVFICSFVCAYVINKITSKLYKKIRPFYDKIVDKFAKTH